MPSVVSASASNQLIRTATGTHFIASNETLSHVSILSKPAYEKMLPYRWKEDPGLKITEIIWREDMAVFVLEWLRKSITTNLEYLSSKPTGYVITSKSYDDVSTNTEIAAVLWLGPVHGPSDQEPLSDHGLNAEKRGPPPYAMHLHKGHYVPYYDLIHLLGPANVSLLRRMSSFQSSDQIEFAVIKAKRQTIKLQLELWRLLGFLAKPIVEDRGKTESVK